MTHSRSLSASLVIGTLALLPTAALGAAPTFGARDEPSLFSIGQNLDRDEVHYALRLDEACRPRGTSAVFPYWRRADGTLDTLGPMDEAIYGVREQKTMPAPGAGESKLLVTLRATSERSVAVFVKRAEDGRCVTRSIATIQEKPAELRSVHAHVGGLFAGVDWIELRGTFEGRPIVERVKR